MSVATQLGLNDPDRDLLASARHAWPDWGQAYPQLPVVADLLDLPQWLARSQKHTGDQILQVLARVASPTGGDDVAAAGALAWVLLPGACLLAHRMRTLTPRIDEVVAAQLWLEVRSFGWERGHKVAANILLNTRRGVLRDLGVGEHLRRNDPTWAQASPLPPDSSVWRVLDAQQQQHEESAAEVELDEALSWAVRGQAIGEGDRDLLLSLAVEADRAGVARGSCGQGGLCSRGASRAVANQRGVSESTIRRRASHCLHAVAAAYAQIWA